MYDVGKCLLSDRLLQARMTQQELADKLGVTKQQINHYSTERRIMTLPVARNIAYVLRCDIEDLYEWIPVKVRNKRR